MAEKNEVIALDQVTAYTIPQNNSNLVQTPSQTGFQVTPNQFTNNYPIPPQAPYQPIFQQIQPPNYIVQQPIEHVNDCFPCSILNLLFCNLIFGIIALVFSIETRNYKDVGNYAKAKSSADMVKLFNIIGLVIGLCCWIPGIIAFITLLATGIILSS